ncbi:MAG: ABC transporter permease [Anaerolineales bacterium]|nr:ABC transporter permease [Anaerolineales bacterium]
MLSKIFAITLKDSLIRFSSRSELLFFLILPIAFTVLLSGTLGGGEPETGTNPSRVIIVDEDGTHLANALIESIAKSEMIQIESQNLVTAQTALANEEAVAVLTIPAGFQEGLLAGETAVLNLNTLPDNSDADLAARTIETAVSTISQPIQAAHNSLQAAEQIQPFVNAAARSTYFQQGVTLATTLQSDKPSRVNVTLPAKASETYDNTAHQSIGQMVTWVFIPLLGTSALFVYERTQGTLRRILTTPTKKSTYLSGTISGQLILGLIQMIILIGFSAFVLKVNWGQSPLGLAMMLVTFGLAAVALGTALGTIVKTSSQANNASIMLGMSMALLGGCWFPIELFPPTVQQAVKILPTTWAMAGLTDLVVRGQSGIEILPIAAVLLLFALLFFTIGVWRFRFE